MHLSWSHKLFLSINAQLGKRTWLDKLMYLCAVWLIYILGALVLGWGAFAVIDVRAQEFRYLVKLLLTAHIFAISISYIQAYFWRHPRPETQFPDVKKLFHTMETWKSFPSDHATISFLFAFVALIFGVPLWFGTVLIVLATIVSIARVYAGVHYPRDVIGGMLWAALCASLSPWVLQNVAQPIFNWIKMLF